MLLFFRSLLNLRMKQQVHGEAADGLTSITHSRILAFSLSD